MINHHKKPHQRNSLGAVLYKSDSPYVLRGYVPEISKFVSVLLLKEYKTQDQKLDDMIYYLMALGIQAYYNADKTPFEKLDLVLGGTKEFFKRGSITSNFNIFLFQPDTVDVPYSKYVTDIGTNNLLLDLQPLNDVLELVFPTIVDQLYVASVIQNTFNVHKNRYESYTKKIPSSERHSKTAFEVLRDSLVPFYNTFKLAPDPLKESGYLQTILFSFLLCDLANRKVGTLSEVLCLITPKVKEDVTSKSEKVLFTICFREVKKGVREKVKIDALKAYSDAQTVFDCSLSFSNVLDFAQKLKAIELRFEGTEFVGKKIQEILANTNAQELLYKLGIPSVNTPKKNVSGVLGGSIPPTTDVAKCVRAIVILQILILDTYVKNHSFYSEMVLTNEGILKLISSIPRFSGTNLSKLSADFLQVAKTMFEEWDVKAWNSDGSVRDAKNIILFPVAGSKGPHDNKQLSPAACDLTPLNTLSLEEHDRSLNIFLGKTNFELFKGMRDAVFTPSSYLEHRVSEVYKQNKSIPKNLDPGIVYLFLIYCEFLIQTYVFDHAILFSENDILEKPPYDAITDLQRYATKDPLIRNVLIALGFSLTVFTAKKAYDKIKRKSRKKS